MVIALGALSAFGPLCLDMYLPALPELADSLGSTATLAQVSLSACIVGLAVGQLVVGPWSDRVGRRGPLLAGLLLFVLTSVGCALTTSMPLLIGLRLLQGAAGAAGIVIGRAVVADRFSGTAAASYYATMAAINGLAPILAPVIGAQVLRFGSWRIVFWVLAGIGVLLVLAALRSVPESLPPDRRSSGGLAGTLRGFRVLLADRVYLGWVLAGTMVSAAMFGYISASPFLLQDGFGLSEQWFSLCFALNALGIVLLSQVGRVLVVRFGSVRLLSWASVQGLVGAALLGVTVLTGPVLWAVIVSLFVMVSSVGLALPHSTALAMELHRETAGAASALIGTLQFLLGAVTAPLVGIGDRTTGGALAVTALVATVLGVLALALTRRAVGRVRPV
ncbi:Bcr/CflA family efflux MFS transporter [Nakamurella sp. YIM 132087]|uniref:Bcr/CflA family efflux MFS transporter n=1 Tax=Nakamurella alba TaxID=2665158 RepID=A0A7K1FNF1_9ACTN|nr:Bcr/CflA family efflux MFS transporter [Nakamurella alba]